MEDERIVDLYWQRSELAISETKNKYENLLFSVANNILFASQDVEECVNDTYFSAWNAMPDARPKYLSAFLCKITKNLALKRYEYLTAAKRNCNMEVSLHELEGVLAGVEAEQKDAGIAEAISTFLRMENYEARNIFMRRYFFYDSIQDIAARFHLNQNTVKTILRRTRIRLKKYLEKEGLYHGL